MRRVLTASLRETQILLESARQAFCSAESSLSKSVGGQLHAATCNVECSQSNLGEYPWSNRKFASLPAPENTASTSALDSPEKDSQQLNEIQLDEERQQYYELWRSRRRVSGLSERPAEPPVEEQRVLQTAILGCPNAGKSTLTNRLIGFKVSAVSNKTNTTNAPSFGAYTEGVTQLVLHDTPGIVDSRNFRGDKHKSSILSAFSLARECDMLLLIIDAYRQLVQPDPRIRRLVSTLSEADRLGSKPPPVVLLLNKVDKIPQEDRQASLELLERGMRDQFQFDESFHISAARGDGIQELKDFLVSQSTLAHWIIDPENRSAKPVPEIIAEVVREKLYRRLHQELPYKLEIKLLESKVLRDGSLLYRYNIVCPSEAAHRIVVGSRGRVIGEVGIKARQELQPMLQTKLHLYLRVE